jgi:hypothetical protein
MALPNLPNSVLQTEYVIRVRHRVARSFPLRKVSQGLRIWFVIFGPYMWQRNYSGAALRTANAVKRVQQPSPQEDSHERIKEMNTRGKYTNCERHCISDYCLPNYFWDLRVPVGYFGIGTNWAIFSCEGFLKIYNHSYTSFSMKSVCTWCVLVMRVNAGLASRMQLQFSRDRADHDHDTIYSRRYFNIRFFKGKLV